MYTTVKSLNRIHKSHKKQNTHYCRWLNMLKFMCFLTDLNGSKIYSRGRGGRNKRVPLTDKHSTGVWPSGQETPTHPTVRNVWFSLTPASWWRPGESGSIHHLAGRWANPACLHHFFHFEKSPDSLLSLDGLRNCLLVFAETQWFENWKDGTQNCLF